MIKYQFAVPIAIYAGSFAYLYARCADRFPLHKYISNHALLLAPLNFLFTFFQRGHPSSVIEPSVVPGLDKIKANYPVIRAEAKALLDAGIFQRPPAVDEPGFNSFEKGGYRIYSLKWYTKQCGPKAVAACPQTCAIMDAIPAVRSAMFTVLPPGARIGRHHDPLASSLRYHLGLMTPNSEQCALTLDGVNHAWRDGEELLFDQTYLHSAANNTDTIRIILFCDVEKTPLRAPIKGLADFVNSALLVKFTGADDKGKLSWVSWAYRPIYKIRHYVKEEIKPKSRLAYDVIKYGSIAAGLGLIYLAF